MPFPQLTLVQSSNSSSPTNHFTELVTYLTTNPAKQSIYFHSITVYNALLIGASTSEDVSLVVAHDYPEKYLLLTGFVVNNLKEKLVFEEPSDTPINI